VLRRIIHVLARLAITASCTSSASAFDASHVFRAAVEIAERSPPSKFSRDEIPSNKGPFTKSLSAPQQKLAV
jgi:hypothetical protein